MNIVGILAGFLPFTAFSLLAAPLGAGAAALVGLGVGVAAVAMTARGGIKVIPVVQAVILAGMAVVGFVGDPGVRADLVRYGPAVAALLTGVFMVITAAWVPFTAQFARSTTPREVWNTKGFFIINRRISTAWGLAVLLLGVCHLAGAALNPDGGQVLLQLAVNWVIPVVGFWQAAVYTRRTVAMAGRRMTQMKATQSGTPA